MKLLLIALVIVLSSPFVRAQVGFEPGIGWDPLAPPATIEEVAALAIDAELGEAGVSAVRSLVEGCDAKLRRDGKRMDRAIERAYILHTSDDGPDITKIIESERIKRLALHEKASSELLADLKALISPTATEAWGTFERRRRRRTLLCQSFRTGVRLDLVEVARNARLLEDPAVRQVLLPYEIELDRLLVARSPLATAWMTEQSDPSPEADRAYTALRDADCAILRLQRSTTEVLLKLVPPDRLTQIRVQIHRGRSPFPEEPSSIRQRSEKLLKIGRLEEDRRKTLKDAVRAYDDRLSAVNAARLTKTEDQECSRTYAESLAPMDRQSALKWYEQQQALDLELFRVVDRIATEEDLDAVDE